MAIPEALDALRSHLPSDFVPTVLITLGSGLNGLANSIDRPVSIPYDTIPGMGVSTAPGHEGRFVAGFIAGVPVLCMQGRLHPYEGYRPQDVAFPIRVARQWGAHLFMVTNAAGGINAAYHPGQVVAISDHINLTGQNPLIGPNDETFGPRFPDMSYAYSPRLRRIAQAVAFERSYELAEGVYLGVSGPCFETPAEIRAFRTLGANLVGMSTVWEVIAAVHCGFEVLGFSLVTNMAAGMLNQPLSSAEVNEAAEAGSADLEAIVNGVLVHLGSPEAEKRGR